MADQNISGNLFLSYRRDDSSGYALMIWEQVKAHFGKKRVFIDIDTIQAGEDFRRVIEDRVRTCDVVLVLLGKGWSKIADESGRRLNNPNDPVRLEVSTALRQDVLLVPVLVGGASMPRPEDLPADIQALCDRNAWEMHDRSFRHDLKQLISFIEQVIREREDLRRQEALSRQRPAEHGKRTLDELGRIEVSPEIEQDAIAWIERATKRRKQLKLALSVFATLGAASAFYVIGAVEQDLGKSAPWFVLGTTVLSCAVRTLQIESNDLFGRDDVYTTVEEAFGRITGHLAASALLFDAMLVGPICAMVAGAYIAGEINIIGEYTHLAYLHLPPDLVSIVLGVALLSYYWRKQVAGRARGNRYIQRALLANAALVAVLLLWCALSATGKGSQLVPFPSLSQLRFSAQSLGWLRGTAAPAIAMFAMLIAFGNSIVAVTGEESLSQTNALLKAMRLTPLRGIAIVNLVNGFFLPALVPFFFVMLIPDSVRLRYWDYPLAGLIYFLVGPFTLRLSFALVFSILGAVILLRVISWSMSISATAFSSAAGDTRLLLWATRPRIIHVLAIGQLAMIVLSRGNATSLLRAYGLGVGCSFTLQALSLLIFRYKRPRSDRWLVPVNITIGRLHLPIGLSFIAITLFVMTSINLFTRVTATVIGSAFAIAVCVLFTLSSRERSKAAG